MARPPTGVIVMHCQLPFSEAKRFGYGSLIFLGQMMNYDELRASLVHRITYFDILKYNYSSYKSEC